MRPLYFPTEGYKSVSIIYSNLPQLKQLALNSALRYRTEYTPIDADTAYNYAVSRCGYENPLNTDTDYALKQYWLLEIMKLWFYYDIHDRYLLKFDVADLKLSQATKNIKAIIENFENAFVKAKEDVNAAHLFVNAEKVFAGSVIGTGLTDDVVGQDYRS